MKAKTKKYWLINNLRATNSQYNIAYGGRSDGKSYACKHHCAEQAVDPMKKFIYLRRWDLEIKPDAVSDYFKDLDVKRIFGSECEGVVKYGNKLYVTAYDETTGRVKRWKHVGYCMSLSAAAHYTGGSYLDVENILYEEFISRDYYLKDETTKLQDFVSTIARDRDVKVWMVGNALTRFCPYFSDWELTKTNKQKQGEIAIYKIATGRFNEDNEPIYAQVAVEFTEASGTGSKMFFGQKSKMITEGGWQTDIKPKLERRLETYRTIYTVVIICKKFMFLGRYLYDKESSGCFWYIERKTTEVKPKSRIISDTFSPDPLHTIGFVPLSPEEREIFRDIDRRKVVYSDNLTGTEFQQACRELQSV